MIKGGVALRPGGSDAVPPDGAGSAVQVRVVQLAGVGSWSQVAVVKPGRIPISIVNNEMSKRRTSAQVAFVDGDRLLGEEAAALSVRFPDQVYARCGATPRPMLIAPNFASHPLEMRVHARYF